MEHLGVRMNRMNNLLVGMMSSKLKIIHNYLPFEIKPTQLHSSMESSELIPKPDGHPCVVWVVLLHILQRADWVLYKGKLWSAVYLCLQRKSSRSTYCNKRTLNDSCCAVSHCYAQTLPFVAETHREVRVWYAVCEAHKRAGIWSTVLGNHSLHKVQLLDPLLLLYRVWKLKRVIHRHSPWPGIVLDGPGHTLSRSQNISSFLSFHISLKQNSEVAQHTFSCQTRKSNFSTLGRAVGIKDMSRLLKSLIFLGKTAVLPSMGCQHERPVIDAHARFNYWAWHECVTPCTL